MNRWSYKSVYLMSHIGERNRNSRDHRHAVLLYCFFIWFPVTFSAYLFPHHLPVSHGGILKCYCKTLCRRSPPRLPSETVENDTSSAFWWDTKILLLSTQLPSSLFHTWHLISYNSLEKRIIITERNANTHIYIYVCEYIYIYTQMSEKI